MIKEAIILAGGFGTRLQSVVADRPKPMALVCGKSFLHYIFQYLKHYKIQKVILSVGHKAEIIQEYFGDKYDNITIDYAIEKEPMGTGGGIRMAMEKCNDKEVLVLNGDSFFNIDLIAFYNFYINQQSDVSLAVRHIEDASRYGTIQLNDFKKINLFTEKTGRAMSGIISAGIYIINRKLYLNHTPINKNFSIEKEFFEPNVNVYHLHAYLSEGYFIDIGIPEDYAKAQEDFREFMY